MLVMVPDLRIADVRIRQAELRMVEDVERLGAELESGLFAESRNS